MRSRVDGQVAIILGVMCLSLSPVAAAMSAQASSSTTAFLRCGLAMVVLAPLAIAEMRRRGRLGLDARRLAVLAGIFLGIDYILWVKAVYVAGAGVTTVLINVQVLVVPLLALWLERTPIGARFWWAMPLMVAGVVLVGGLLETGADAPDLGGVVMAVVSGVAYGAYIYVLRRAGQRAPRHLVGPVAWATGSAALVAGGWAVVTGDLTLSLAPSTWGWLIALALAGQVIPWLLIGRGSRSVAPATVGALMLGQPVLAVLLGVLVLGEPISLLQWLGCLLTVLAIAVATLRIRRPRSAADGT
ncbi:EamA family transporter [Epidermidibacterium keratini]|uniref:EamA family transporter n=1 Tax=Epidermidibacterium keratini TaxID=1891644 RepID=A0A7L4YQC8_9ACTN|nr:DMT family transporter [Epidermidibacterium keratini]QHC01340.1 EamA family transporter [Epidermidibacterium keratini]